MTEIRIAHLSDLHIGSPNWKCIWNSLREEINKRIKPHLVLVTGDIVHSPSRDSFDKARKELDSVIIERAQSPQPGTYFVCPGNHDRHPLGNAPGWMQNSYETLAGYKKAPSWFDNSLSGHVATTSPIDIVVVVGTNKWNIRIIGFDSSAKAKYSAQGFASQTEVKALGKATEDAQESDIVLALHHHHLLPIRELEESKQRLSRLFQPTIMLNAGTVLEVLTSSHVNMVLHGHEHQRSARRYGTLAGRRDEIVVLGSGSATGNDSRRGCAFERASFNLIELGPDRAVHIREVSYDEKWNISKDRLLVLEGRAVRRSRFNRCTSKSPGPPSRLMNCVEFHPDRNIDFTQVRTNWTLENGLWTHTTTNSSGWLTPAELQIFWPGQQNPETFNDIPSFSHATRDQTRQYEKRLGRWKGARLAHKIVVRLQWQGGAVLTQVDLSYLDPNTLGDFRRWGLEFASLRAHNYVEAASLVVRLPPEFAPNVTDIQAFLQPPNGQPESSELLLDLVQHHAPGIFSVEIPFPRKGYRYSLAWPPVKVATGTKNTQAFCEYAKNNGNHLLELYDAIISRSVVCTRKSLGLYLQRPDAKSLLFRAAQITSPRLDPIFDPPPELRLDGATSLHRLAWWGRTQAAVAGGTVYDRDAGFITGERALVLVPIRYPERAEPEPWGLIRIGLHCGAEITADQLVDALDPSRQRIFTDGMLAVLQKGIDPG
jgi:predicted MPP superfamily phosphohydrolase